MTKRLQSWWRTTAGGKFWSWERLVGVGVITPALAAVAAMATLANALLWMPLPIASPETLLVLATGDDPDASTTVSYSVWRELEARGVVADGFAWAAERIPGRAGGAPVDVLWVSGRAFQVLGVAPAAGRLLGRDDDAEACREPAAVVSHEYARVSGQSVTVGGQVDVGGVAFDVVGVGPEGFHGLEVGRSFQVALPIQCEPLLGRPEGRFTLSTWSWLRIGGRIDPRTPKAVVEERLAVAQSEVRREMAPRAASAAEQQRFLAEPWRLVEAPKGVSRLRRQYGQATSAVTLVALALLLVASANVGMLAAERVRRRGGEAAVRLWMGATRRELVQAELLHVATTVCIAWALSLPVGVLAARVIVAEMSTWALAPSLSLVVGLGPAGVALGAAAVSGVVIATWPVWRVLALARTASWGQPKEGERTVASGTAYSWFGALQCALAYIVVSTAAVLVSAYVELDLKNLGFNPSGVLVSNVDLSGVPANERRSMWPAILDSVGTSGSRRPAALATATPLGTGIRLMNEVSLGDGTTEASVLTVYTAGAWFEAIGVPIESGRTLSSLDTHGGTAVVVLSHTAATRLFGGTAVVGQSIMCRRRDGGVEQLEVVGISGDVTFTSIRDEADLVMFRPLAQSASDQRLELASAIQLVTAPATAARARLVAETLARVHPAVSVSSVPMEEHVRGYTVRERVVAELATWFGLAAVAHVLVGLWAAQSAMAALNRRAAAIRLALGANAVSLAIRTTGRAAGEAAAGVMVGVVAAALLDERLKALVTHGAGFETYVTVGAGVAIVSLSALATSVPAWAIARTNLARALRQE